MLKRWNEFNRTNELFSFTKKKQSETEIYENKLIDRILQILNDENGSLRKVFYVETDRDIMSHKIYRYEFIHRPTIITITKRSVTLRGELNIEEYKFQNVIIATKLFKIAQEKYKEHEYNLKLDDFDRLKDFIDKDRF